MKFQNLPKMVLCKFFNNLDKYLNQNKVFLMEKTLVEKLDDCSKDDTLDRKNPVIKYVNLGVKIVRLIIYDEALLNLIERQLSFVISDSIKENNECGFQKYDATIVVWKEDDIIGLPSKLSKEFNPAHNLRLRIEMLAKGNIDKALKVYATDFPNSYTGYLEDKIIILTDEKKKSFYAYNHKTNTYYFAVNSPNPESFIKHGHIFVKIFYKILKTDNTSLVHGAVVGLNGKGVLFCARGHRGKSTLAVTSLIEGFNYVADDYLVLNKENESLYSYPIYSIITLSPEMYSRLYNKLNVKFVSNNVSNNKYVFNISSYHNNFKTKYPIRACIFPEIKYTKEPDIIEMEDKGRAIAQIIHSTIKQMRDEYDTANVKKLVCILQDFRFYQFNLSFDIFANTRMLRDFIVNLEH